MDMGEELQGLAKELEAQAAQQRESAADIHAPLPGNRSLGLRA